MNKFTEKQKGTYAIIMMAFLGSIMGVWVRFLGEHFETFQQVAVRAFAGFLIGLVIYRKQIRFKELMQLSKKDIFLLIARSAVLLTGISLFTQAVQITKYANIGFIFSLPTTAFLGIIFLKEKVNKKKVFLMVLGFLGAALVAIDIRDISSFAIGKGEILALISIFFYSFSYIIRKWFSPKLNNQEIAEAGSMFSFIFAFVMSLFLGNNIKSFSSISPFLLLVILLAGATFILIGFVSNYGFERLEAVTANNLIILEAVFSLLIGLLVYQEVPVIRELIGGVIILISAYGMNRASKVTTS